VSLFSTPSVGGYVTKSSETTASHNDLIHAATHGILGERRTDATFSSSASGSATTSEILQALVSEVGNVKDSCVSSESYSYQHVLVRRAMERMVAAYVEASQRAAGAEETLRRTAGMLSATEARRKSSEQQRVQMTHRAAALEQRLKTFVIEECDVVEGDESVLVGQSATSGVPPSSGTMVTSASGATFKNEMLRNGLGDAVTTAASIYQDGQKFVRLSTTLYNDLRRERDRWKEASEKLKRQYGDDMKTSGSNIVSLQSRLESVTKELNLMTRKVSEMEVDYDNNMKTIRMNGRKRDSERREQKNLVEQIGEELASTKLLLSKESMRRETLSTEMAGLRVEQRRQLTRWKERQKDLTEGGAEQRRILMDRQKELEEQVTALEDKVRWSQAREENKRRTRVQ
jgi:hypothetical protein